MDEIAGAGAEVDGSVANGAVANGAAADGAVADGAVANGGGAIQPEDFDANLVEADIEVLSGHPDATDIAAVTAVLSEMLGELSDEQGRREAAVVSAWGRSQRTLRAPLHAQAGAWRSFSA